VSVGARLAGAEDGVVTTLASAGENLGVAMRICEDLLALACTDPVTGRRPGRTFQEGDFSLAAISAVAQDRSLAARLVGEKEGAEWEALAKLIRLGPGMAAAARLCRQYAGVAKRVAANVTGADSALVTVCDLPVHWIELFDARTAPSDYGIFDVRLAS